MYLSSLLGQLYSIVIPFVILLGVLVFVHELGHFAVARLCGVRVEVFSLGFGKKLFSYKKGDTVYCISLIPLGGYVKMFGEQQALKKEDGTDGTVLTDEEKKVSFSNKTVWQRIAIVLAGPLMNFIFAIFVFGVIAQIGEESRSAIIAEVEKNSDSEQMGLSTGDRILSINQIKIQSYEQFQKALNQFKNQKVEVALENINKEVKKINLQVATVKNPNIFSTESEIGHLNGVQPLAKGTKLAIQFKSEAYALGFRTGDEVTAVGNLKMSRWSDLEKFVLNNKKNNSGFATFLIDRPLANENEKSAISINVDYSVFSKINRIEDFGFENSELYLEQIVKGSPAELAELQKYDKIVSINSKPILKWEDVLKIIKSFDGKDALEVKILRDGAEIIKKITPQVTSQMTALGQEDKRYTIGIVPMLVFAQPEMTIVHTDSIFHSILKGYDRTIEISSMTVFSFVRLFQGEVSHKNIGGMISIGKAAKDSFEMGLQAFLSTMGILSVSLFILNLLPIPVLDGGHLVFYVIEVIKGSPLSLKKMEMAQQIGFILLMGLMCLAIFNDFTKFFFKS